MYGRRHPVSGRPSRPSISVIVLLGLVSAACAEQWRADTEVHAPLFSSHAPLRVTIEAPLTTLLDERPDDEYLHGRFSFYQEDASQKTVDLKIRTRGQYRRMKEHCEFPPIKLNFRRRQLADTEFAGQDKLKLVTHCRNYEREYEQFVLLEFLAYRILGVLTDKSYRVRLMQVTYVDTEGGRSMTRLAFVIESADALAARVGMNRIRTADITSGDLDRQQANLVNVFQYLIGNTDYSLFRSEPDDHCCHNSDLMSSSNGAPYTPLPYDFDFSGFVNTPYAEPHPRYNLRSVRHRLFKGHCGNNELLPGTFQTFFDNRLAIYAIVEELDALTWKSRLRIERYLNAFYRAISEQTEIASDFVSKCVDE